MGRRPERAELSGVPFTACRAVARSVQMPPSGPRGTGRYPKAPASPGVGRDREPSRSSSSELSKPDKPRPVHRSGPDRRGARRTGSRGQRQQPDTRNGCARAGALAGLDSISAGCVAGPSPGQGSTPEACVCWESHLEAVAILPAYAVDVLNAAQVGQGAAYTVRENIGNVAINNAMNGCVGSTLRARTSSESRRSVWSTPYPDTHG